MYFYEVKCIEPICGWNVYFLVMTNQPIRSKKNVKPLPDKLRILIEDRDYWISEIKIINVFQYIWRKYLRPKSNFYLGYRCDWELEEI